MLNHTDPIAHEKEEPSIINQSNLMSNQNTMPKVEEKADSEHEDVSDALPADNAINKTGIINEVYDQIFNGEASTQLNLVDGDRNKQMLMPHKESIALTEESYASKVKKVNTRSFNSKSIEIKKSLTFSNDKAKIKKKAEEMSVSDSDGETKVKTNNEKPSNIDRKKKSLSPSAKPNNSSVSNE